ncbi:N-acetylmuramoyl-L-alanine amidase [Myxococcota bacterium]|nr:N-acetylmuramoyl-L-alanine amidase [Myxococcota bacterium]
MRRGAGGLPPAGGSTPPSLCLALILATGCGGGYAPQGAPAPADPPPPLPATPDRIVVLDPGHGGTDEGAHGVSGVLEKDITLAIARQAADALGRTPGTKVLLTREDDRDVTLPDRAAFANARGADAFVSIHANSHADRRQGGVETYFLDTASDDAAARLAARENAAASAAGPLVPGGEGDVRRIVGDLRASGRALLSSHLAARVQRSLVDTLAAFYPPGTVRDRGARSALFYVLLGSDMPAVLVEVAYLTHPDEERRLRTRAYQAQVADALAGAVHGWLDEQERPGPPPEARAP